MSATFDAFLAPVATEVLLTALARLRSGSVDTGASLWIGSPWISDVPLFPGIFSGSFPCLLPGVQPDEVSSLSRFANRWLTDGGALSVLVQGYDPNDWPRKDSRYYNRAEIELLIRCAEAGAEVLLGSGFHAKFIVTPGAVLQGTVNLTYSGLYKNEEHLTRHAAGETGHDSARTVCENSLANARSLGECDPTVRAVGRVPDAEILRILKEAQDG